MSDNPFDVFAADLKAAVPPAVGNEGVGAPAPEEPLNIMAPPSSAPVPVMNQPVMNSGAPEQQAPAPATHSMSTGSSMNGGYGQPMGMGMGQPMGGMQPPASSMNGQQTGMPMQPPAPQYGAPAPQYGAPAPQYGAPAPQYGAPQPQYGAPQPMGGMPPAPNAAMVPSANQSNPYAVPAPAPQPVPASPGPSPFDAPASPAFGGQPPHAQYNPGPQPPAPYAASDPFSAPTMGSSGSAQMGMGAPPAMPSSAAPFPPAAPPASEPWAQPAADPWAQPTAAPDAIVPAQNNASADPFGVFNAPVSASLAPASVNPADTASVATPVNYNPLTQGQILAAADGGDPWADMGFGAPSTAPTTNEGGSMVGDDALVVAGDNGAGSHREGELPPGGEWYDARIFTPTLGVMFFKPQELTDSLFLQTDRSLVQSLDDRPVVAFIVEGSSARAAGVELGHCLLKVNGIDVKNPKEASRLIKEGPRPLPLLFYVPDTTVVVAEGEHMVKYDTRETGAPNSAKDWKPKYCVIGGIIAQPWMMNMYRSKSEYDIAVIETQARRPVSVKVKQFSLQGARVQNDWQGPQMVKYKNKLHPWKYVVILPVSRNPIKISSPNLAQLKPVHEGIRRVLMAQQRHNPNGHGGPPQQQQGGYNNGPPHQQGGYAQPPPQQQQYAQPPPQQHQQYAQPPPQQQQYAQHQQQYAQPPPQQQQQQQQYAQEPPQQDGQQYSNAGGVGSARRSGPY